jgi:DNA polymerase-3 subunit alpha (Gram-positive type)
MSREILLETPQNSSELRRWIEELNIPPESKEPLREAQLRSILITLKPATLICSLHGCRFIPHALLAQLSQSLSGRYSPTPNLVWDVHFPEGVVSARQYLEEYWPGLLHMFAREVNMAGAYLSLVRFTDSGNGKVRMALPNELSVSALKRHTADKIMGRLLSERLGKEIQVVFEMGDFNEEVREREALYQRRVREELERIQLESDDERVPDPAKNEAAVKRQVWKVAFGRKISSPPVPAAGIREEEDNIVLEGELVTFECKVLRTGRQLALMDVYDKTGSINARLFLDAGKQLSPEVKLGAYVRVRGTVQHDKYSQDLCLLIRDINLGNKPVREDTAVEKRVELHAHTQMSAMDAMMPVAQLVEKAASFGHPAIAITDHGVVQGYPEALAAGAKYNIKILYGIEGYLVEDHWPLDKAHKPYHVSILIASQDGVKNLYRLVSEAHLQHFYRHPRMPRAKLQAYRKGLILGSACEQGELFRRMLEGASEPELEAIARNYDYLEIMPRGNNQFLIRAGKVADEEAVLALNRRVVELGQRLGIPVVATGDVHFLEPGDEVFRSILQFGMGFDDAAQQAPLYFKTTDEMLMEFAYLGEVKAREVVVENPRAIADRVEKIQPIKSTFHPPVLPNAEEELKVMAFTRAKQIYGDPLPEAVSDRLKRETEAITKNSFASLFLIARKLVKKSLEDGYLVGSRGSVGSALAATMLGITEVNPLPGYYLCPSCQHFELDPGLRIGPDLPDKECPQCKIMMEKDGFNIPFEVFMGFKGDKLPDIDLNFSGEYQSQAHKYLEEIFDREHIFRAGTISTVAERIAYGFVKKYLEENKLVLREAEVNRLTRGCAGVKKTTGQHPGGIMIVPGDMSIYDFTPVQRPADADDTDIITTHFDYHAIHDALLKLDILGHDDPTSLKRLGDWTGVDVRSIPLDDPETLAIYSGVGSLHVTEEAIGTSMGTLGIPEFGTEFVRQMLEATKPTTFSELVRISGLSHGTDVWLNNAADLIKAKTATLTTVICTRDDIMIYLIEKGMDPSLAFKIMESVRKGKGVAPDQVQAMNDAKVPEWYIESCQKIKYMFPKAHAVAYCIMSFRIAYFKVHFPTAFYANYFSLNAESFDAELVVHGGPRGVENRIQELKKNQELTAKEKNILVVLEVVREAFARGMHFRPVSLAGSEAGSFKMAGEGEMIPPLIALPGLGFTCALNILRERKLSEFRSVEDFSRRTGANKNVVEIMTQHGCLKLMPKSDQTSLFG